MSTTAVTASAPPGADSGSPRITDGAAPSRSADTNMRCPDPSAHQTRGHSLQDQASAAALYSTNHKAKDARSINPLGPDGKLSSASAATSLKYAKASDLPSFPVVGIDTKSSAGTAALLANQNKKSPEWWKPEQSSAAGKAALLAHDYKMAPLWQPEASAAGSKAALLAHRDGAKLNLWKPEASAEGNSAANIAMRKQNLGPGAVDYGYTDAGRKNAFTAATGAHASSRRLRAQSSPPPAEIYPDSRNSAKNALSAAMLASSPSMRKSQPTTAAPGKFPSGAMEAARIQHAKSISKDMYTSAPPVALEVEEKKHNDALRASAISMAKKIYDVQQQQIDGASAARSGATAAHGQQPVTGEEDIKQQAMRYIGIQEAAQKLAQERLAKIGYDENAAYRSYYGYEKPRSKLSMRRGRNRANSDSKATPGGDDSESDEDDFRSRRIRSQMEHFNKQLADVDAKKRENDRKSLIAAAERKVQAQMQGMDKKIYDETGKMSPAMVEQWDEKARQKAQANSETRMENHGKVHVGGGRWMDQSDIDAIAQARIQPTLDEITEKTDKRRAEDEKRRAEEQERKLELEEKKRRERIEKERAAEIKAEEKQAKEEEKKAAKLRSAEEKATAKQEKEAAKHEREAEKARKTEGDRQAIKEKRKSKEVATPAPIIAETNASTNEGDELYRDPTPATSQQRAPEHESDPASPTSPTSPKGLKSIFGKLKRRSKHTSAGTINTTDVGKDKATGFAGGATLNSSTSPSQPHTALSDDERPHNLGDVEPSSVPHVNELDDSYSDVSSLSNYEEPTAVRGRSAERITTKSTGASGGTDYEEAHDKFDEALAPPPTFTTDADKARKGSPNRDSKFREVGI
ncbi:hypothetical protein FB567DRAFT_143124 [Paraphoma chrysanthemicola]|uniref:Eisosome protein 1 n=1 Tax=Paraphoma chrysanthemicola TaxID=798071 RepID=A0A8K0QXG0_9PLEO|nr:hypothetical protein FB567DRAFT_143124 [Paraphoma chrysanthemicola]